MNINIVSVHPGTDKQIAAGIQGNVTIELQDSDGSTVARLTGISIRKTKTGDLFLAEPSFSVDKQGKTSWYKHFQIFPNSADPENKVDREKRDQITQQVIRMLNNGGTKRQDSNKNAENVAKPASSNVSSPWGV